MPWTPLSIFRAARILALFLPQGLARRPASLRELVIPFGSAGYVALFEIEGPGHVTILAVRHQREEDYH